ncbi:unnamed protein product [Mytilus edulis]|uniref:Reverse transcriptase domain-containing protein n=1 Tax=Mytilus edulis TaxID=6550 RepID=A0A8S3RYI2_MYTED|nr:unnamed protein product [Mytilus edulis]
MIIPITTIISLKAGVHTFISLQKKEQNQNYDTQYLDLIEKEAKIIIDICKDRFKHNPITEEEISKAISCLNRNKAADFFGVNAENIIHGGKQLQQYLQLLINRSFELGCISDILKIEFERESKDLKLPTYIALLDGKSAFDVVVHSNLIRRLYQTGIYDQSIILIDSLYKNATSCIKWRNKTSAVFEIEQGVRQGGAISADLYKLYVNPLLNLLCDTGIGGHIGNISCCAPTCADDVAIIANNPIELQTLVNIAVNFSRREGYTLQPTKSVILPVNTSSDRLK